LIDRGLSFGCFRSFTWFRDASALLTFPGIVALNVAFSFAPKGESVDQLDQIVVEEGWE